MKTSDFSPSKPARSRSLDDASIAARTRSCSIAPEAREARRAARRGAAPGARGKRGTARSRGGRRRACAPSHPSTNPATSRSSAVGIEGSSGRSGAAMRRAACCTTTNCHGDIVTRRRARRQRVPPRADHARHPSEREHRDDPHLEDPPCESRGGARTSRRRRRILASCPGAMYRAERQRAPLRAHGRHRLREKHGRGAPSRARPAGDRRGRARARGGGAGDGRASGDRRGVRRGRARSRRERSTARRSLASRSRTTRRGGA